MYCPSYVHSPMYKEPRPGSAARTASRGRGGRRASDSIADVEDSDMEAMLGLTATASDAHKLPQDAGWGGAGPYLVTDVEPFEACHGRAAESGASLHREGPISQSSPGRRGLARHGDEAVPANQGACGLESTQSRIVPERMASSSTNRNRSAASTLVGLEDLDALRRGFCWSDHELSGDEEDDSGPVYVPSPLSALRPVDRECRAPFAEAQIAGPLPLLPGIVSSRPT